MHYCPGTVKGTGDRRWHRIAFGEGMRSAGAVEVRRGRRREKLRPRKARCKRCGGRRGAVRSCGDVQSRLRCVYWFRVCVCVTVGPGGVLNRTVRVCVYRSRGDPIARPRVYCTVGMRVGLFALHTTARTLQKISLKTTSHTPRLGVPVNA